MQEWEKICRLRIYFDFTFELCFAKALETVRFFRGMKKEGSGSMQITDVKVRKVFENSDPMKAVVSVTFDGQLAVHDIKVIYAKEKYFIVMPSRKNPDGTYRDIVHPINSDFRAQLEAAVIDAYNDALAQAEAEAAALDAENSEEDI